MAIPIWKEETPPEVVRELLRAMGNDPDLVALIVGDSRWTSEVLQWDQGKPLPQDWMAESLRQAYRAVILLTAIRKYHPATNIEGWFLTLNANLGFEAPLQVLSRDLRRFQEYLDKVCEQVGFRVCPECRERSVNEIDTRILVCFACGYTKYYE